MGTAMTFDVRSPGAEPAVAAAVQFIVDAEKQFSWRNPDSELSNLRRGTLRPDEYSPSLREILEIANKAYDDSQGAFDIRRPDGQLDTDGIVKGWAVQRASDLLTAAGLRDFSINAGGDVTVVGRPEPDRLWQVGLRDPQDAQRVSMILKITDAAVATSGTYERGFHIWDGRTGLAADAWVAVTVVAADLITADVLATSVMALGRQGPDWAVAHDAIWVLATAADGSAVQSSAQG